jgi:hypothetical protein
VWIGTQEVARAQAPHQKYGSQHAVLFPAPRRCHHALAQAGRRPVAPQRGAEIDVLHQRQVRKPAHLFEEVAAHEHGLVASCHASPARAQVHERRHHPKQRPAAVHANVEAAPQRTAGDGAGHQQVGIGRQHGVGVQEQQHVRRCALCAGIHLCGTAARGGDELVRMQARDQPAFVGAAAIHDDQLRAPFAQRP